MKSGKTPTEKDFDAAVESVLYSALLGGLVKNLGGFQKKWAYKNKDMLQGTIFPARLAKLAKGQTIPNTLKAKMWAEVMNKVSDEALKAGYKEVSTRATGKESESQLTDMAAKVLLKDKKLQRIIDRELIKAMKKNGLTPKIERAKISEPGLAGFRLGLLNPDSRIANTHWWADGSDTRARCQIA